MNYRLMLLAMLNIGIKCKATNDFHDSGPFEGFVVGGVSVPIMMYPHVAQLKLESQVCGGSIISERVVLTAAHCLYTSNATVVNPERVNVYLGSDNLMKGYKYSACRIVPHERYNGTAESNYYYYDLGLILLKEYIQFGPRVKMMEIADTEDFRDDRYTFTIAGFGAVTNLFPSGPNKKLKATRMFYVNSKTCDQAPSYGPMHVPDHMFCLIGEGWTSDCFGDSGSGIIWRRKIVGIVATGRDVFCGSDLLPSMYTDIVYFRQWVMERVTELESIPANECVESKKLRRKNKRKFRKGTIGSHERLSHNQNSNWGIVLQT